MFREMATFVFFVMTGYKFRPASNNPYFSVPTDDDMDEFGMGEVLIGGTAISEQERVTNDKIGCAIGFQRVPLVEEQAGDLSHNSLQNLLHNLLCQLHCSR